MIWRHFTCLKFEVYALTPWKLKLEATTTDSDSLSYGHVQAFSLGIRNAPFWLNYFTFLASEATQYLHKYLIYDKVLIDFVNLS